MFKQVNKSFIDRMSKNGIKIQKKYNNILFLFIFNLVMMIIIN